MILISGHQHHLDLARALHREKFNVATIYPQAAQALAGIDVPAQHIMAAAPPDMDRAVFETAANLIGAIEKNPNGSATSTVENLGGFLYARLPDLIKFLYVLDLTRPELIVLHNDVEAVTRCAALWARANKVPCLHVPHAIYQRINRGGPGTDVHDIVTASHLAVAGPFQRKWYEERGVKSGAIRETGIPNFDRWYSFTMDQAQARALLGCDATSPVITYCSTWVQTTNIRGANDEWIVTYENVLKTVKELGLQLVVKLHPVTSKEMVDFHGQLADTAGVEAILTQQYLEISLKAADVVVAYGSNTIIDGAFAGARLVAVRGYEDDNEVVTTDPNNVGQGIKEVLATPRRDYTKFLAKWAGPSGPSTERIVDFIKDLLPETTNANV